MCKGHARFWIVLKDSSVLSAVMRHQSREEAKTEALRLAQKHPGTSFYVAAIIGAAVVPIAPEYWIELEKVSL